MSTIYRTLGIPARLLVLMLAGGGLLGLLASLMGPILSSATTVLQVNTQARVVLSPLALPSKVYDANGKLIANLQDSDFRRQVTLAQIAPIAKTAVLDVEDRNFYTHGALDYSSILRAAKADLTGHSLQGGSTITQQLIKQTVLTSQRTIGRKLKEAVLAIRLEKQMTKNQIYERYLNTVYFGNGAYGIGAAAYTYFNEEVGQLTLAQSALLASMIENPSYYDPITHPENTLSRRDLAVGEMLKDNDISAAQASVAESQSLPTKVRTLASPGTPTESTFLEEVINSLENNKALGATSEARYNAVFQGGLSIYTTLDPTMQSQAEAAVAKDLPNTGGTFTAALVAVDPSNGEVRALVPGNNSPTAGFDVVTGLGGSGGRQPGSSFKLFSLLSAISQGYSVNDTVDGSAPCYFSDPGETTGKIKGVYEATNAEGYTGSDLMTLTYATVQSINCAYLRLGLDLGLPSVVDQAAIMGVTLPNPTYDSLIIGGEGVEPIAMAGAYATMADGGVFHTPTFIDHVVGPNGKSVIAPPGAGGQVVSAADVAIADGVLEQVPAQGTGTAAALAGRPSAGKTGTTDNFTNAWYDGYTPQLATVVWMGDPSGSVSMQPPATPQTVFGGTYPAQIWHTFMTAALAGQPVEQFPLTPPSTGGKYLAPPLSDVSGQYGQAAPTTGPSTPPPAPPTCTTAPASSKTVAGAAGGAPAGGVPAPNTTSTICTPATTTSTTSNAGTTTTTFTANTLPPVYGPTTTLPGGFTYPPTPVTSPPLTTTGGGSSNGSPGATGTTTNSGFKGTCTSTNTGIYCNTAGNTPVGGGP
ncbi:MAG: transglycosylase domain-containing protein [Acidimicrobiales bacterium]